MIAETRVPDPVPIALDDEGNIYLFSFNSIGASTYPRLIALDQQASIIWDQTYETVALNGPRLPKLLWDGEKLRLFWLADGEIYGAIVNGAGNLMGPDLFAHDVPIMSFDAAVDRSGSTSVWFAGPLEEPGLYMFDPDRYAEGAILVDPDGVRPDIQYDAEGTLHAIWSRQSPGPGPVPIQYGAYPEGRFQPGMNSTVIAPRLTGTTTFTGPTLGLDVEDAYVFWSRTLFSGLEAGRVEAEYVYFPKGDPSSVAQVQTFRVPYAFTLTYEDPDGALEAGPRVALESSEELDGTHITEIAPNGGYSDELAVALGARLGYPMRKTKPQISAAYFRDGTVKTYQQLNFTPTNSISPSMVSDPAGGLYLTWLEKGDVPGWGVYLSGTSPALRAALSGLDEQDVGLLMVETAFGLTTGALLLPVAIAWGLPSFIVLALTQSLRKSQDELAGLGGILSLALALLLLWAVKLAILPAIQTYVPFSAWIPVIPIWLHKPLRIGVPALIAGLSILAAWAYLARKSEGSPYRFVAIYAIVDGLLTMAVYGVFIYGAT
ncbi:MAG: hypothetical protein BMS9Abin28_0414 [Anaerolineae bacterium]|nr:MAG: hypothetical protein BMS9Abin28_0414 [Anaerolineae bacterium]